MSRTIILFIALVTILFAVSAYFYIARTKQAYVACTMEAKMCPDGSYVGRTGPNCEFAACPGTTPAAGGETGGILPNGSGIRGRVVLGPTCPVERVPSDPNCADKPYQTLVTIFRASDPGHAFLVTKSDAGGIFKVFLPPGEYTLAAGENKLPRCGNQLVTVKLNTLVSTTISCDTGIR